jgi:outer membrane protein assembly factor BamB
LLRTITTAGVDPERLAAVYLTGGATRTPYVAGLLARTLGRLPTTSGDPKAVVVLGALTTPPEAPRGTAQAAGTGGGGRIQRPEIAAAPWTARLGVFPDGIRRWYPAHVVDGDVIYAQSPGGLFAFDARSGELLWENAEGAGTPSGRLYVAGDLLISAFGTLRGLTSGASEVWAVNKHSGTNIWRHPLQGGTKYHGLAIDDGRVFVNSAQLSAFTLASGELLWSVHSGGYGILRAGDLIYIANEIPGRVTALSPDSGRQIWTTPTKDQFWCVPASDGNHLFVGAGKNILALDMNSGGILWKIKDFRRQAGTIGVGADGHIYPAQFGSSIRKLRAYDGKEIRGFSWHRGSGGGQNRTAAYATESHLYATSDDGLLAFRFDWTGYPVWQRKDLKVFDSTVTAAHGLVYVITDDGQLHAVDAATGTGPGAIVASKPRPARSARFTQPADAPKPSSSAP